MTSLLYTIQECNLDQCRTSVHHNNITKFRDWCPVREVANPGMEPRDKELVFTNSAALCSTMTFNGLRGPTF
ncbi:hypothetical protein RRG08_027138 [Elysia crispata]|uniref:Uncharacterized protein n=1 Tax=Elysia crispata TaxID=231223 RepID=A0AAE0YVG1_9GAST|nr:hypothetical protein RRG08_027138 [Elysia crispata]